MHSRDWRAPGKEKQEESMEILGCPWVVLRAQLLPPVSSQNILIPLLHAITSVYLLH